MTVLYVDMTNKSMVAWKYDRNIQDSMDVIKITLKAYIYLHVKKSIFTCTKTRVHTKNDGYMGGVASEDDMMSIWICKDDAG